MATLATQNVTRAGTGLSLAAAAGGGDAMTCGAASFLIVSNTGGSSINVTLVVPASIQQLGETIASRVVAVPNATTKIIGPVLPQLYQDPTTGLCTITYSAVTSVTVGAFSL